MIRAIVFDCFGVLVSDGWGPFKRRYFGDDPDKFKLAGDLNRQVNIGMADYNNFIAQIADLAGVSEEFAGKKIQDNPTNDELFEHMARVLKPRYKLGVLSNAGDNWLPELLRPEQLNLFDEIDLSYQSGFTKPDENAYQHIADKLGVEVKECVMVDDQEGYCMAARDAGMQAVWYQDFDQYKSDLERLLTDSDK